MADKDSTTLTDPQDDENEPNPENPPPPSSSDNDDDDSNSDSDSDSGDSELEEIHYTRPGEEPDPRELPNDPETNIKRFMRILESKRMKRMQEEEEKEYVYYEDLFDFPKDPENWREEDLKELWADAPLEMTKPGWDPVWADEDDWDIVKEEKDPPFAPFYLPYRKPYPVIPDNHYDISNPKSVVEELDRIEEFLNWVSYIFEDGSSLLFSGLTALVASYVLKYDVKVATCSYKHYPIQELDRIEDSLKWYEGTVWDDLAHGKGVYVAEQGLVRYEGEWLQNNMEGHGVVEVDIPDMEPVPGSKLEMKMRAEGKIISRDFMSPEDKAWLEMDIEDSIHTANGNYEIPFYENDIWIQEFGKKPEKGRYRYAGQWKHGRMHGCGVYEVNERTIYGRFYFGELLEDTYGCDENVSALHSGIAEVAAAKARMFVNKPDGMVREERGPYSDPQHPYFYEEEDVWMAPGFINQFYEVPDYWKTYVSEVDQEREMWLNSFYKAPLRIPMPAELEHWWSKDETPEFVLINKEPEPDPEDPTKRICTEDPLILHTPTGRIINYIEDETHGIRLFWQPPLKKGEDVDPEKAQFLPLGFDEFYGREVSTKEENVWKRLITAVENACKPVLDNLKKFAEEQKKESEMRMKLIEAELENKEAELDLEVLVEYLDEELKKKEKEEEKKMKKGFQEEEDTFAVSNQDEKPSVEKAEEGEGEGEGDEEEEEEDAPSSFGTVIADQNTTKSDQKGNKPGKSPFSTSSLSFASCSLISMVPSNLQQLFLSWKERKLPQKAVLPQSMKSTNNHLETPDSVRFPLVLGQNVRLRATATQPGKDLRARNHSSHGKSQLHSLSRIISSPTTSQNSKKRPKPRTSDAHIWQHAAAERDLGPILSLHMPIHYLESNSNTSL